MEESLGAEDPAIEIARLLRPVEARTQTRGAGQRPLPAGEDALNPPVGKPPESAPAGARPTDPEPLLLGTSETPEVGERAEPSSTSTARTDGRNGAGQASRRSGLARRASDVAAFDRRAAGAPDTRHGAAPPPSGGVGEVPQPPTAPTSTEPETEPLGEALPRCLTEPWDDPDPAWPQAGQDKGARRWPFRRGRPGHDAAGQEGEDRRASHGSRTRPDDEKGSPR